MEQCPLDYLLLPSEHIHNFIIKIDISLCSRWTFFSLIQALALKIYVCFVAVGLPTHTQYMQVKVGASTAGFTAGELSHSIELTLEM